MPNIEDRPNESRLHPKYEETTFSCISCDAEYKTRSTEGGEVKLDVCSGCHPFFTGKHKLVDTAGRVERFRRKYANVAK